MMKNVFLIDFCFVEFGMLLQDQYLHKTDWICLQLILYQKLLYHYYWFMWEVRAYFSFSNYIFYDTPCLFNITFALKKLILMIIFFNKFFHFSTIFLYVLYISLFALVLIFKTSWSFFFFWNFLFLLLTIMDLKEFSFWFVFQFLQWQYHKQQISPWIFCIWHLAYNYLVYF